MLPRLRVLQLQNFMADYREDLVEAMIRSRWWTDDELAALSPPPGVARLQNVDIMSTNDRVLTSLATAGIARILSKTPAEEFEHRRTAE